MSACMAQAPARALPATGRMRESGQHGDLLDLIRLNRGCTTLRETLDEARAFLSLPRARIRKLAGATRTLRRATRPRRRGGCSGRASPSPVPSPRSTSPGAASPTPFIRLRCVSIRAATIASRTTSPALQYPALLAAVTDLDGQITGVSRTWLAPDGSTKADLGDPRRALGNLLGGGVRFSGAVRDVLVAGEGLETVLSLRRVLPRVPMAAGPPPAISLRSPSLPASAAFMSPATAIQRACVRSRRCASGLGSRASRRCGSSHRWPTISMST